MNKKNKIISVIFIIIILILSRYVFLNHFFNLKETVVPNVLYMKEEDAIKLLKKADLKYNIIYSKTQEVNDGYTFIQHPKENSVVKVNRSIQLWVNKTSDNSIPNIVGQNLTEARKYLEEADIQIARIDYIPIEGKEDKVIAIYPKIGSKLGILNQISLLVGSKELISKTIMPNLIGLDLNDAIAILAQIDMKIKNISDASDPSFPINSIVATTPLPGDPLNKDSVINVVLNSGQVLQKSITEVIEENKKAEDKKEENLTNTEIQNILDKTLQELDKKEGE